jgi:hypothetical protein
VEVSKLVMGGRRSGVDGVRDGKEVVLDGEILLVVDRDISLSLPASLLPIFLSLFHSNYLWSAFKF